MENSKQVSLKPKNRATICSYNPTTGHISRENENLKRYMHPSVHSSTIYNSQNRSSLNVHQQMNGRRCGVYIHTHTHTHTHTQWNISQPKKKKNDIMPLSAIWHYHRDYH